MEKDDKDFDTAQDGLDYFLKQFEFGRSTPKGVKRILLPAKDRNNDIDIPTRKITICTDEKYVMTIYKNCAYIKICDKNDEFNWKIGLGLLISKYSSIFNIEKELKTININNYRYKIKEIIKKEDGTEISSKEYREFDYTQYALKALRTYVNNCLYNNYDTFVKMIDNKLKESKNIGFEIDFGGKIKWLKNKINN